MNDLTLPGSEFAFVGRLAIKPTKLHIEMSISDSGPRHSLTATYDFNDKLAKFGKFLFDIAKDVEQAGGYVRSFQLSQFSPLSPANERPDDYDPNGRWRCMHVEAWLLSRERAVATQAAWDDAVRAIVRRRS